MRRKPIFSTLKSVEHATACPMHCSGWRKSPPKKWKFTRKSKDKKSFIAGNRFLLQRKLWVISTKLNIYINWIEILNGFQDPIIFDERLTWEMRFDKMSMVTKTTSVYLNFMICTYFRHIYCVCWTTIFWAYLMLFSYTRLVLRQLRKQEKIVKIVIHVPCWEILLIPIYTVYLEKEKDAKFKNKRNQIHSKTQFVKNIYCLSLVFKFTRYQIVEDFLTI